MPRSGIAVVVLLAGGLARAHDIPNARVDRAIQVGMSPGALTVDYEVSLAELTLTQDLRSLIGSLPGGDREAWFRRYGDETGPLNGRGLLLSVDGEPTDLTPEGFTLAVEDHPRFTFRYRATIPEAGRLRLIDSNYAASEGVSRLALRVGGALSVEGELPPAEVASIPLRPAWTLTPEDERRGRRLDLTFRPGPAPIALPPTPASPPDGSKPSRGLGRLLDETGGMTVWTLALVAFGLGAVHSLQPGHGKTLVAAGSVGPSGGPWRGVSLGLAATLGHLASVSGLAAILWATGATDYPDWNATILHASGFVLAAIGLFRLGQILGGLGRVEVEPTHARRGAAWAIGLAAGVVPCWDAVGLLLIASAVGRLRLGLGLVAAFSLGMATVLVGVGVVATRIGDGVARGGAWARRLGIVAALVLIVAGGSLLMG